MEITNADKHNLLDLFHMCTDSEVIEILKLNKMNKWFNSFLDKLEMYCVPEINAQSKPKTKNKQSLLNEDTHI